MAKANDLLEQVELAATSLVKQAEGLDPLLGEEKQAARLGALMAEGGYAADGPFRYAPKDAVEQAAAAFKAEDDAKLGRAVADIEDGVKLLEKLMPPVEDAMQDAPTVEAAIRAKVGNIDQSPSTYLNAHLLDATLEATITPKVQAATIAEAAAWYREALADPLTPRHAATIRAIEDRVTRGTFGPSNDPAAADALADLARQVTQQRQARVPEAFKVWRTAVARGRRTLILARAANVRPAQSVEQRHLLELMKTLG